MGADYTIEWLAPPRSEPRVLRRGILAAASLEVAVAQARIELTILRRLDDAVEGFRLSIEGKIILSRWLQPDGQLSEIPLPPKAVSDNPAKARDDSSRSEEPKASRRAA